MGAQAWLAHGVCQSLGTRAGPWTPKGRTPSDSGQRHLSSGERHDEGEKGFLPLIRAQKVERDWTPSLAGRTSCRSRDAGVCRRPPESCRRETRRTGKLQKGMRPPRGQGPMTALPLEPRREEGGPPQRGARLEECVRPPALELAQGMGSHAALPPARRLSRGAGKPREIPVHEDEATGKRSPSSRKPQNTPQKRTRGPAVRVGDTP